MGRTDNPELEITFQTRGLQWGCKWDISALLALSKRYPSLKSRYSEDQDTGQGKLFFTCGRRNAQKDEYAAAISKALAATSCVLSIDGRKGFRHIEHRSRHIPSNMDDMDITQPEFGTFWYPYELWMTWRSACTVCPKVHDKEHNCCRLAAVQPATTGVHGAQRVKLSDGCLYERFKSVEWPVAGSRDFGRVFPEWYAAARMLGVRERNNELKRRVDAAVFRILPTAKILLRAKEARLPPELILQIVEHTYSPVLTRAQFDKLLEHAADGEETRAVARVLCAAARERTPRSPAAVSGENRRIALRDEWLWNGGFVYSRSYMSAKRELGAKRPLGDQGRWPWLEDRAEVMDFLRFGPEFHAAWPYDEDGKRINVTPHTNPDLYPPWPERETAQMVFCTIETWAPCTSADFVIDSEDEERCRWLTPGQEGYDEALERDQAAAADE